MIKYITRSVIIRTLSRLAWMALAGLLAFGAQHAFAQSTDSCSTDGTNWYKWSIIESSPNFGGPGGPFASKTLMCNYAEASFCGNFPAHASCSSGKVPWNEGGGTHQCRRADNVLLGVGGLRTLQTDPATQCPANPDPEVECTLPALPEAGVANFGADPLELDPIACDVSSQCLVSKRPGTTTCSLTSCGAVYSYLNIDSGGAACDGATVPETDTPPPLADPESPVPAQRCTTVGEAEYCSPTGGEQGNDAQCGFLNDVWICLPATPAQGCQARTGGGVLCDPAAGAPPAPDNGTPGTEATPDGQVIASPANSGDTTTYNYYDNDTVNNSSGGVVTGHTPTGNDQDGDGFTDGDEEEGATGSASGGGTCDAAPVCEGDPIACAQLQQEWMARCPTAQTEAEAISGAGLEGFQGGFEGAGGTEEVELPSSLDDSGWWSVSGCPAATSINIKGQSMNFDLWQGGCAMASNFAPLVMGIAYLLGAFMLIGRNS